MADKNTVFFFSLDEILDTRLAILDLLNPEATLELLKTNYYEREVDDWELLTNGKIKNEDFKKLYKNRNKDILKISKLTAFSLHMKEFSLEAEKASFADPTVNKPKILLNLYPYTDLNEVEIEAIRLATDLSCASLMTEVETTYISPFELTPDKVKNDFDFSYFYHFEEWKNLHIEQIASGVMRGCYVTAPKLYLKEIPDKEISEVSEGLIMTPWQAAELCMLPFMVLNHLPVKTFSLYLP